MTTSGERSPKSAGHGPSALEGPDQRREHRSWSVERDSPESPYEAAGASSDEDGRDGRENFDDRRGWGGGAHGVQCAEPDRRHQKNDERATYGQMAAHCIVTLFVALGAPLMVISGLAQGPGEGHAARRNPPSVDPWRSAVGEEEADCAGAERSAARRIARGGGDTRSGDSGWEDRYGRCPFAPHVGTLAMLEVWGRAETLPNGFEQTGLDAFEAARAEKRRTLISWSRTVRREFDRRGFSVPGEVFVIVAGASLAIDEVQDAARVLREGEERGVVGAADVRWMEGVSALVGLRHAEGLRGLGAAVTGEDRLSTPAKTRAVYLRAVLLDRLGDRDGAATAMRDAQAADKDQRALRGLLRALPIHEALYVRGLARQFSGRGEALTLRLWAAYLSRTEPEAPERALARRHMDSLAPRPTYPR